MFSVSIHCGTRRIPEQCNYEKTQVQGQNCEMGTENSNITQEDDLRLWRSEHSMTNTRVNFSSQILCIQMLVWCDVASVHILCTSAQIRVGMSVTLSFKKHI